MIIKITFTSITSKKRMMLLQSKMEEKNPGIMKVEYVSRTKGAPHWTKIQDNLVAELNGTLISRNVLRKFPTIVVLPRCEPLNRKSRKFQEGNSMEREFPGRKF